MTKEIITICHNIGMIIFESRELLINVVQKDQSLNSKQIDRLMEVCRQLIHSVAVVNNLNTDDDGNE